MPKIKLATKLGSISDLSELTPTQLAVKEMDPKSNQKKWD